MSKPVVAIMAGFLLLLGVSQGGAAPLRVAVSIAPLQGIAERLCGAGASVTSVMAEDGDPHTFSPSPRMLASLSQCSVLFTVGVSFEAVLCDKLARMFPQLRVVNVSAGLASVPAGESGHEEHEHDAAHEPDPHLWLSLPNLRQMATTMAAALQQAAPDSRDVIARNLKALTDELDAAHADFARRLAGLRSRTFYVYHPAFGSFARDYGLVQQAVEIEGKAPSPRQLAALIDQAKREGVKTIFVQPQFQQRTADILASRIGGRVVPINPLSRDPVALLRQAVETLSASPH